MASDVNQNNFQQEVIAKSSTGLVLVDFWAPWCGPCRAMNPILEKIAADKPEVNIVKVNIDDNSSLAVEYQIMSIPSFIIFKNGAPLARHVGSMSQTAFEKWVNDSQK